MKLKSLFFSLLCLFGSVAGSWSIPAADKIDLSGIWRFQLDPMGFGKTPGSELYLSKLTETIVLPGSMDQGGKGIENVVAHVDRLSRKFEYYGQAWYQREVVIPQSWEEKEIILSLERCHWETAVYVDGVPVGMDERLSVPNRFVLTGKLKPGVHTLTLCVDNRLKYPMDQWNHGTTEYTQTNWNGVVGKMELQAMPLLHIRSLKVYTDLERNAAIARIKFSEGGKEANGFLTLTLREKGSDKVLKTLTRTVSLKGKKDELVEELVLDKGVKCWSEFHPDLYTLEAKLAIDGEESSCSTNFGFRKVEQGKHHIRLNGRDIHLRGALDCAVFPLTGYPATDVEAWKKIFTTVKAYGMNHVRFHSWCPPEAAFDAADEVGIYLQAELPMWIKDVGRYPARRAFFEKEMVAILDEYGNHPSFVLMCNGNENEGDFAVLEDLVKKAQAYDDRRLYSASTARKHVKSDQYYVSHVTTKGWITVYEGKPSTDWDCTETSGIDVPVIAHETGQRCMYPNFKEISKYTGVLEARNFNLFRERLARNGMLHQADDFFRATGAHTVLQYKEVNEALLRTPNSGGFQLLGLSDFPGQGSAFVGVLDAFWEDKGLVTPEKYRESCAPIVLLSRFAKRTYTNQETFTAKMGIYHYGEKALKSGRMQWALTAADGRTICKGSLKHAAVPYSCVDSLGVVSIPLNTIRTAGKYTLKASIGEEIRNEWDIWVYPEEAETASAGYETVQSWDEAKPLLQQGRNVLLIPAKVEGRKTRFASHFWNPIMFNWKPMIVGTLIDDDHPAFENFPTSYYADWQWWDVLNYTTALDLTAMRQLTPVIQSIDTYEENRKLGIAFEACVGQGKLFVLCADVQKSIEKRPAMRQLLRSLKNYVASARFNPTTELKPFELDALFVLPQKEEKKEEANEAVRQLLNK